MEQHIAPKKPGISTLQSITNFLIGFLLTFFIMVATLKILANTWGFIIGWLISVTLALFLFIKKSSAYINPIATGMVSSAALILLIGILSKILLILFSNSLQKG